MKRLLCLLVVTILAISLLPMFKTRAETPSIPDPTPGYYETSEYAVGSYAVGVIFIESSGAIDLSTENWNTTEEQNVINKIQVALNNWTAENPNANLTFTLDIHYRVPTDYEPISRNHSDHILWTRQIMTNLGFSGSNFLYQIRDYLNALRNTYRTDWVFVILVVDASNDADGLFADGWAAGTFATRDVIIMPVKTIYHSGNLELRVGHEMGHIFWATDEYGQLQQYGGYLNVIDVDGSGCLMDTMINWNLSGKPHGLNGTWGQVGWRDSNGNGIQDIVDTPQRVYLNPYQRIGNRVNFTGVVAVTPTENRNPSKQSSKQNVTINKIQSVQFRIDNGEWLNASFVPTEVRKLVKYPDVYAMKNTTAIVNFTLLTPELAVGDHNITVRATNQWGISGYANQTVTIPETNHDVSIANLDPYRTILSNNTTSSINVTSVNEGDVQETFNVTLSYNSTIIGTKTVTLDSLSSTRVTFNWNTTGLFGNYSIKAVADQVSGETDTSDNTLTYSLVQVSIAGDVNADGTVNILDISAAAAAYGKKQEDQKWNANADLDESGTINILDISAIAKDYGKTV